jgi:hypothetical protein
VQKLQNQAAAKNLNKHCSSSQTKCSVRGTHLTQSILLLIIQFCGFCHIEIENLVVYLQYR